METIDPSSRNHPRSIRDRLAVKTSAVQSNMAPNRILREPTRIIRAILRKATLDIVRSPSPPARRKELQDQIIRLTSNIVTSGPFVGVQFPDLASWSDGDFGSKLLGSYEQELHPIILS